MGPGDDVFCVLCERSDETRTTGPLSTKDKVTAHQNCLLYSSGIFCQNSPQFDDLFGFAVKDVLNEVKRGSKLFCNKCKKKGATAGCEVKRCKKSYHYPCAIQEGAEIFEDADKGKYGLFCFHHSLKAGIPENSSFTNGCASSSVMSGSQTNQSSETRPSKECCLACEKKFVYWCSFRKTGGKSWSVDGDSTATRQSANGSDSNSSTRNVKHSSFKRRLIYSDNCHRPQDPPAKCRSEGEKKRLIMDNSSDPDEGQSDLVMAIFAPLDSDLDGDSPPNRRTIVSSAGSSSENHRKNECGGEVNDEDETDAESESLLPCFRRNDKTKALLPENAGSAGHPSWTVVKNVEVVTIENEGLSPEQSPEQSPACSPDLHAAGPSVSQQNSAMPPPSPDCFRPRSIIRSPPRTSLAISPAPATSPLMAPQFEPEPSINSASFWRSCNAVGCTEAIFTDFVKEISNVSSRIQSDQASQEDYDLALRVMEASGKLAELVTKQQKELQRKQKELLEAAASMSKVISAMKR